MKINTRSILSHLTASLAPLAVASILSIVTAQSAIDYVVGRELAATSVEAMRDLEDYLDEALADFGAWSELTSLQHVAGKDAGGPMARELIAIKGRYRQFAELYVLDSSGRVVATTRNDFVDDVTDHPAFRAALDGKLYQSNVADTQFSSRPAMIFAHPIRLAQDSKTIIGVLLGAFDWGVAQEQLASLSVAGSPQDARHRLLLHDKNDRRILYGTPSATNVSLDRLFFISHDSGSHFEKVEGVELLTGTAMARGGRILQNTGWVLHAVVDADVAYEAISPLRRNLLLVALGVSFMAIILGYAAARRLSDPIVRITDALKKVAAGDQDVRLPPSSQNDEIGEMTAALSVFRGHLEKIEQLSSEKVEIEARARRNLAEALDGLEYAMALWSEDQELILGNKKFEDLILTTAGFVPFQGQKYDDFFETLINRGVFAIGPKDIDRFRFDRMMAHARADGFFDLPYADGRTIRLFERRTSNGNVVTASVDITEFKRRETAMSLLMRYTREGRNFAEVAVEAVAKALGFHWVGLGLYSDNNTRMDLLAYWDGDSLGRPFSYDLSNTPCQHVMESGEYCHFSKGIAMLFPHHTELSRRGAQAYVGLPIHSDQGPAIGQIFAISDCAMNVSEDSRYLLTAIAQWVGAEYKRSKADQALKASEQRFRDMLDVASDWVWETDSSHQFVSISRKFFLLTGLQQSDVIGRYRLDYPDQFGDDAARWAKHMADLDARRPFYNIEFSIKTVNGDTRRLSSSGKPLFDAKGEFLGYRGVTSDITEARRRDDTLRLLSRAVEQSPVSVVITDSRGLIEYVNPKFCDISGYTSEEAIGSTPRILKSGHGAPSFYAQLWKTIAAGQEWRGEFLNQRKDGALFWESSSISGVRDACGRITHYIAVKEEITARKRAEEELRRMQKMEATTALAGGIAHDFNNILMGILGHSRLALDEIPLESEARVDISQVMTAAGRAKMLVRQLLDFSRQSRSLPEPISLGLLVREVLDLLEVSIPVGIQVQDFIDPDAGVIFADSTQLYQVMMNLCTNAVDAIGDQPGRIVISVSQDIIAEDRILSHGTLLPGRYVRLSLSDSGCGIPSDIMARIFDPFFTTKEVGKGTGLGLASVHGIVQEHHGYIDVQSPVDQMGGTMFALYFPQTANVALPHPDIVSPEESSLPPERIRGSERILLLDDDHGVVLMIARALGRLGYHVETARHPKQALEAVRAGAEPFDLIVTDMIMPGMTGEDFAQELMRLRPDIPVILCTGYGQSLTPERAQKAGIKDVLSKPIDPNALAAAIRLVLDSAGNQTLN